MKMLWSLSILWVFLMVSLALAKKTKSTISLPSTEKSTTKRLLKNTLIQKSLRFLKTSFSSDLERLTLKLTSSDTKCFPPSAVEELIGYVNAEFQDPQLLVNLLTKLSRRMNENSLFTKLKAILALHVVSVQASNRVQSSLGKSLSTLLSEKDYRYNLNFFSGKSLKSMTSLSNEEYTWVEFAPKYLMYVTKIAVLRGRYYSSSEKLGVDFGMEAISLFPLYFEITSLLEEKIERSSSSTSTPLNFVTTSLEPCLKKDKEFIQEAISKSIKDNKKDAALLLKHMSERGIKEKNSGIFTRFLSNSNQPTFEI